ncbi:MAG: hypothetical protein ACRDE2_14220, partial [Chitinophagaceae bacterium]
MKLKTIILSMGIAALTVNSISSWAQQITYSMPQREDDYRNTSVEIIGKVGNNILVYKNNRGNNVISIYDQNMKLVKNVPLQFLPERTLNVDFVAYPDHFQMIYQFQHKAYVYCYGVLMDQDADVVGQPLLIDSSRVGYGNVKAKIYSVIHSDDGKKVLIYKINQDNNYNNIFYTFLFDSQLNFINNSRLVLSMRENRSFLSEFMVSNDGHFVFVKVARAGANGNLSDAALIIKPPMTDSFIVHPLNLQGKYLDEIKLKIDNMNNKVFMASFYTDSRRGNIVGLYAGEYSWNDGKFDDLKFIPFSDNLKMDAKNNSSINNAFNNFFIRQLVVRGDGGFLMTAESYYTTSNNQQWNRWNYMYSPWGFSPYYTPYYY